MKQILFLLLMVSSFFTVTAQQVIQGKVTNEKNEPLFGVTIVKEGTDTGTNTDFDGNYAINAAIGDVLRFSYIGFATQRVSVTTNILNVVLLEDLNELDEVVVVAFGTSTKKALTGALESIKTDEILKQPQTNFTNSLQGLAPGLQVLEGSGQPGEGAEFRIRGIGSLSAGNEPLIVVDGAVFNGGLSQLNPADIESVNVLKDASAASIYGSRAANGVVLITTKIGDGQKTTFSISTEVGFTTNTNPNNFRVMNTAEYVEYYREAMINSGIDPDDSTTGFYLPIVQAFDTNWVDEAFQTGSFKKYDFSARGGNEKTSFFTSLGYTDQKGTIIGTDFERITGTLNVKHKANDKFDYGAKIQLNYRTTNDLISDGGRSGQLSGAFNTAPTESIFATADTNPAFVGAGYNFDIPSNAQHNPVASAALNRNSNEVWSFNTNLNLGYNFTPSLRGEVLANYYYYSTTEKEQVGKLYKAETEGGNSTENRLNGNTFNFIGSLAYHKKIAEDHSIGLKAGFETTRERFSELGVDANDFVFANLNDVGLGIGEFQPNDISSDFDALNVAGFFGRLNYAYKDKIFIEGSLRRDGASNFGEDNRWGTFGAVGLSYVVSDDLFPNSKWVNNLKLRASYGTSGNNNIDNFLWRDLYRLGVDYALSPTDILGGATISTPANPNLQWEKNQQLDIGIDFGLFNNRLSGTLEYFRRNSLDLLFDLPLSLTTGFEAQTINSDAELLNTGYEASLTAYILRSEDFYWRTDANIAFYDQEIVSIPDEVVFSERIWQEGGRSDNWYLQRYQGVDPATGNALYLDAEGNTTPDFDGNESRVVVGQTTPDTYGSVTNTFKYKGLSLSFMVYFSQGSEGYFDLGEELNTDGANFSANQWAIALNRWQQPGDITDVPRALINNPNGGLTSTRFLYDESYVRLQNVSLGYTLPSDLVNSLGMSNISFKLSGQNLWVHTDFPGYDPTSEAYPLPRTITFGANLSF